jgi:hypothetical protein
MKKKSMENDGTCRISITPIWYSLLRKHPKTHQTSSVNLQKWQNWGWIEWTSFWWHQLALTLRYHPMYHPLQDESYHLDDSPGSITTEILVLRFFGTWSVVILNRDNWFPLKKKRITSWYLNLRNLLIWLHLKTRGPSKNGQKGTKECYF